MNVSGYSTELPKRGSINSAGYDFKVIEDLVINPKEIVLAKTGIKAYMNSDEVLEIYPRSSIATKKHTILANSVGIIDSDYFNNPNNEGHILIALYNYGNEKVEIKNGERVAQGIFKKYLITEDDDADEARIGGFGSTNKK